VQAGERVPELVGELGEELVLAAVGFAQAVGDLGLTRDGCLELGGALGHSALEVAGQLLRLGVLTGQLREDPHL
jgi:hypothetical protein